MLGLDTRWITAFALALGVPVTQVHASGHEQQFRTAVEHYKAGRYAVAYGRFAALANADDADAAHIALFMHKFGPTLYGAWWDADPTDVTRWSALIRDQHGRPQPVFVPDPYALGPRKRGGVLRTGVQASRGMDAPRP